jgi:hypothetical protein
MERSELNATLLSFDTAGQMIKFLLERYDLNVSIKGTAKLMFVKGLLMGLDMIRAHPKKI